MNLFITQEQLESLDALETVLIWRRFAQMSSETETFMDHLRLLFGDHVKSTVEYISAAELWENCHDVLKLLNDRLDLLHFREE